MLKVIMKTLEEGGAKPYLVGGYVRDNVLKLTSKDIDVEVFNIDIETLINTLSKFGKVVSIGKSFGVIKLTTKDNDYDFSLPRKDNKVGVGHKGFNIEVGSTLTLKEAASRRDYTFNSLMLDSSGNIIDNFGGLEDIDQNILRHTSTAFSEDPLRVLRGFQFAGRFGFTMAPETIKLSQQLLNEFDTLPVERIWIELWKWTTKSTVPSKGLEVLEQTHWLSKFTELHALKGCLQDPDWHPEGDAWIHTKHVCDEMALICKREGITGERKGILMLSALLHDIGKPPTTVKNDEGKWISPKHDNVGASIAKEFLFKLNTPTSIIEKVVVLVKNHMWYTSLKRITKPIVRRMLLKLSKVDLNLKDLVLLIEADKNGRPPLAKGCPQLLVDALDIAKEIGDEVKPIIMGRHLIELGLKPSVKFGVILKEMFNKQINGEFNTLEAGIEICKTVIK